MNSAKSIKRSLANLRISHNEIKKTEWREIENQDWIAEWKKHWRPTETENLLSRDLGEIENTEKIIIRIEPSMAFGTGTHETTRLCLRAIEKKLFAGNELSRCRNGNGNFSRRSG